MNFQLWFLVFAAAVLVWLLWFSFRYAWFRPTVSWSESRILMYHMVREPVERGRFNKMRVSPDLFRRQVEWLARDGWTFCFLSELIAETAPAKEKRVALTFDDGFRDNLTNALPVLREFNAKATLFPVVNRAPGFDWSTQKKASHAGGELGREPKLSDEEIRAMLASGLIELGGHSVNHANLPAIPEEEAWREISGCKASLEETFGIEVKTFCYPFGLLGEREVALAQRAGFVGAVTTREGVGGDDPFRLPRVKISGKEGMFAFRLRIRTGGRSFSRGSR